LGEYYSIDLLYVYDYNTVMGERMSWGERYNAQSADGKAKIARRQGRIDAFNDFLNGQPFAGVGKLRANQTGHSMMKTMGQDIDGNPVWVDKLGGQADLIASQKFWNGLQFGVNMLVYLAKSKEKDKTKRVAKEIWRRRKAQRAERAQEKSADGGGTGLIGRLFPDKFAEDTKYAKLERQYGPKRPKGPKDIVDLTKHKAASPEPQPEPGLDTEPIPVVTPSNEPDVDTDQQGPAAPDAAPQPEPSIGKNGNGHVAGTNGDNNIPDWVIKLAAQHRAQEAAREATDAAKEAETKRGAVDNTGHIVIDMPPEPEITGPQQTIREQEAARVAAGPKGQKSKKK
jgi:hypothetical protein